jgi:hypothetical protein
MPRDEAPAIGWPDCHLRLVPDPDPGDRAAHLRVLILNATDTFGEDSPIVAELKVKFDAAMREAVARRAKGP